MQPSTRETDHSSMRGKNRQTAGPTHAGIKACPILGRCGGCRFPQDDYAHYLQDRQNWLEQVLAPLKPEPILPIDDPYHYRGKLHASFRLADKKLSLGRYQEESHRVVETDDCLIENQQAQDILKTIRELVPGFRWPVYDEKTRRGLIRHVLLRIAPATQEALVCLVVTSALVPGKANFARALMQRHPEVKTVVLNVNERTDSMILGDREIVVAGHGRITDQLLGMRFRISAASFYQVNTRQTEKLYALVLQGAELNPEQTLLDAYCGVGTLGILAAPHCRKVIGVELNRKAVQDAIDNAKLNRISNIRFHAQDAADFIEQSPQPFDRIIVDPPRAGLDSRFIKALLKQPPQRLVYVSCSPESLADNLRQLQKGFRIDKIQPIDMFPWTGHVETVVLLNKVQN